MPPTPNHSGRVMPTIGEAFNVRLVTVVDQRLCRLAEQHQRPEQAARGLRSSEVAHALDELAAVVDAHAIPVQP